MRNNLLQIKIKLLIMLIMQLINLQIEQGSYMLKNFKIQFKSFRNIFDIKFQIIEILNV